MDLDETRTLIVLAAEGSVSGAAARLGVSRATVRRRLAALEARVGVPLAGTTEAGVELTLAGEIYAEHAAGPVRELDAAADLALTAGHEPLGCLDVALPVGTAACLGPLFVRGLLATWPALRVRVRSSSHPVGELDDGADAALCMTLPPTGEWVTQSVGQAYTGLYASQRYLDRVGAPETIEALGDHTLLHTISAAMESAGPEVLWPLRAGGHVRVTPQAVSNDMEFIDACVRDGLGITLKPTFAAGELVPLLPELVGDQRTVWGVTTRAGAQLPRVRAAVEAASHILDAASKSGSMRINESRSGSSPRSRSR